MHAVPMGEWVCSTCKLNPDTLADICSNIHTEHTRQAKQLDMIRFSTRGNPHTPVEHVRSLCSTPDITWAAYLALYSEQDEAMQIVGGPSTINNTSTKKSRKDTQQTRYLVQWGHTYVIEHHLKVAMANGYTPQEVHDVADVQDTLYLLQQMGYCTDAALKQQLKKVTWQPTWEPEDSIVYGVG